MISLLSQFAKVVCTGIFLGSTTISVFAGTIEKPKSEVVLTITGAIANTNSDGKAEFDMEMLKALPHASFKTSTTWTSGVSKFDGVSLKALLAATGASGSNLHSIALNDYGVDVPTADAVDDGPIIAYAMDDKPMSVRDKGPLWIIYPFDAKPDYRTEAVYSRSIWQLAKIDVQK